MTDAIKACDIKIIHENREKRIAKGVEEAIVSINFMLNKNATDGESAIHITTRFFAGFHPSVQKIVEEKYREAGWRVTNSPECVGIKLVT